MSDYIRQLLQSRLPADAVEGDYLQGKSMANLMAEQQGVVDPQSSPDVLLQLLASGQRPGAISSLQLDR